MTLGTPSTGTACREFETVSWQGATPPRDEFFWISQINKCTLVINTDEGLLDPKKSPAFARGLKKVIADASVSGSFRPKMYIHYEPLMIDACGIDVTAMHAGRSSQDMHTTFQRAIIRDLTLDAAAALLDARRALLKLAEENKDVVAPSYTNGVAAQPESLGHMWLGHLAGFTRDFEAIEDEWKRLNRCPMGTTVLNGTSWPLNRARMAAMLGFDSPIDNAFDAGQIAGTDVAVSAALRLVQPMMHVVQFIQDVMVQYAEPHPWILVSATYASSAMPQKRNPGSIIDVRRDANDVLGSLFTVLWRAHALPTGMYDAKDIVQNGEPLREAAAVIGAFAKALGLLRVDAKRALDELNQDWTASQELADILMRRFGIPFRLGHRTASRMVTVARENGFNPLDFPYAEVCRLYREVIEEVKDNEVPQAFPLSEAEFREALDPIAIVKRRATFGGPQPAELERQLREAHALLEADAEWLDGKRKALAEAEAKTDLAFEALAAR